MKYKVFAIPLMILLAFSQANALKGESIYNLKSQWTSQDGKIEMLSDLKGRPVVIGMIYTSCKDACPLLVSDMQKIEKELGPETANRIQFVLVSFDPDSDTPEKLKSYAKAHSLDLKRWTLFHGSQGDVRELAAVLDVRFKKIKKAAFEHSSVITILDSEGVIKHQQAGLNQDPKETLDVLQKMVKK